MATFFWGGGRTSLFLLQDAKTAGYVTADNEKVNRLAGWMTEISYLERIRSWLRGRS